MFRNFQQIKSYHFVVYKKKKNQWKKWTIIAKQALTNKIEGKKYFLRFNYMGSLTWYGV